MIGAGDEGIEGTRPSPFRNPDVARRVAEALARIAAGVRKYGRDGINFGNREGLLPARGAGYYKEFTVDPLGAASDRGAERLVAGQGGEVYYTPNHYGSFVRIQ